jgi:diacylglycerol kinase (ATP)
MKRRLLILANPQANAGRALPQLHLLLKQLQRQAVQVDLQITENRRQAVELAQTRAGAYDGLIAAGGDGTANAVAHGLLLAGGRHTALGILPLGTGNDAARAMGLGHPEIALRCVVEGRIRRIDVIEVQCQAKGKSTHRVALVYAAAGFAAEVLRQTTPLVKRWFGPRACYTVGLLRALAALRSHTMRVRASQGEVHAPLLLVAAGNSEVAGAGMMRLFPGADMEDGRFDVLMVSAMRRLQALRRCAHLYRGTHLRLPEVRSFTETTMSIDSQPETEIQVDGEICGSSPASFHLRPQALRVLTCS